MGHRQAVAWIDDWYGMSIEDVRDYEQKMQQVNNFRQKNHVKWCNLLFFEN